MNAMKFFNEYKETINFFVFMLLIVVFIVWAYNLGHYESLQYQKWHDECVAIKGRVNFSEVFQDPTININISVK